MTVNRLTEVEFARFLGCAVHELSSAGKAAIALGGFEYEILQREEREAAFLRALKVMDSGELSVSGPEKRSRWEAGWSENLQEFGSTGNLASLVPRYVKRSELLRINGEYVRPHSPDFERNFVDAVHAHLFERYFADVPEIFEFGCGTGINVVTLARQFPSKIIHGLDWAPASKKILERLSTELGGKIRGHVFDMFQPDPNLRIPAGSGVFTAGALEQLGENFSHFLDYLIAMRPSACVHVEPIYEFYDEDTLFDYVAARYMRQRNWLRGFLPRLRELERQGRARILLQTRTIGTLFHDGFSLVVWQPSTA